MNLFKKSKKKNDLPYLEVSIIRTQGNKEKIFQILEKKAKIAEKAVISFDYNLSNPILRIEYPSEKTFLETYRRDQYVYESAIKLVNLGVITPRKIKNLSNDERKNTENMYLILKYKTNYKAPILKNYTYTYKLARLLGLSMHYEEVDDGILLFYHSKEDFEIGRIDLTKFHEVKKQLEERGAWQKDYEKLWNKLET